MIRVKWRRKKIDKIIPDVAQVQKELEELEKEEEMVEKIATEARDEEEVADL